MKFLRFVFFLFLIASLAAIFLGVMVILYNAHPAIEFTHGIVDAVFQNPAISSIVTPTMDMGTFLFGVGAAFLVINSALLIVTSKHKIGSLRIFLFFVFLFAGSLGASLLLTIYKPDITVLGDFLNPIFPSDNKFMTAIAFSLAGLLSFIGLWIALVAPHKRKVRVKKDKDIYEMHALDYRFEEEGDTVVVSTKSIVTLGDMENLCRVFQKMFNNGYCRILHVDMSNNRFTFGRKENESLVADEPLIEVKHEEEDFGEPYSERKPIMGTRKVLKEFVVEKEGEIKLSNGQTIYRQRGSTFKDYVEEEYVKGYKYVWYQSYEQTFEYFYSATGKTVVAEDGTKMYLKQNLRRETSEN